MSDMVIYSKEELIINVINQFQDAVIRARIDYNYHVSRLKTMKPKTPEYKMFKQKRDGFKAMLEDKQLRLTIAREYLDKLRKGKNE